MTNVISSVCTVGITNSNVFIQVSTAPLIATALEWYHTRILNFKIMRFNIAFSIK